MGAVKTGFLMKTILLDASRVVYRLFENHIIDSRKRFFLSIFVPLSFLYAFTASWDLPYDPDAITNAVSAWHLGQHLSPFLPGYERFTEGPQALLFFHFVMTDKGAVSKYPPGAAFLAAPIYAVTPNPRRTVFLARPSHPEVDRVEILLPTFWQATIVSVLTTAAAISFLGLVFLTQGSPQEAWVASWVAGLGTSAWSIASDMLWQHGPAMLWLAFGLFLSVNQRFWSSGLAFAGAVLTRPHTAVIPACVGFASALRDRSSVPIWKLGLASLLGVLALVLYNYFVFGSFSTSGGYGGAFTENLVEPNLTGFFGNLLGGLFDPAVGVFVWSPFLLLLLPGILKAWRKTDLLLCGAAIGGLLYLLLQFKMNRYKPGLKIPYRYPLEALFATAPLLFASYLHWLKRSRRLRSLLTKAVVLAIGLQLIAVLFL
ncbi:MAG: hypothetical protein GVY22_07605 [Gammaproteobacteria bacterium]|jgi:hypothetical protein|nr:hypothetical protein [Gammaproteobacteria bacterium]